MQGQEGAVGSLQETFGFNHGSMSSDGDVNQQICSNNLQNPAQNHLPEYMSYSNETSIPFYNPVSQERQNATRWSLGESSSAPNCASPMERKTDHEWSSTMTTCPGPSHFCNERQFGPSDILSLRSIEEHLNSNQIENSTLLSQCSNSSTIPHGLSRSSVFEGHNDRNGDDNGDDCQVMECTPYKSDGTGKEPMSSASASGTNGYLTDDTDSRPESSLDGRRFCKRKVLEGYLAQSSGSGSSNNIPLAENKLWHSVPASSSITTGTKISVPIGNRGINLSEQVNPRLGLTIGRAITETPLDTPASRNAESSRRNFRVRINSSHQQDHLPSNRFPLLGDVGNVDPEQQLPERFPNIPLELRSISAAGNTQRQPVVMHVPSQHRSAHARWNSTSSARTSSLSSFSAEINSEILEEPNSRSVSRNISECPAFIPSTDERNLNQNPPNGSLAGRSTSAAGNIASTSHNSSSSVVHASSPTRDLQRNSFQYSRRLSELVRRSLLSSAGTQPGHRGSSPPLRLSSPVSQEVQHSGNHGHHTSSSRSALMSDRHGAIGVRHSWRTLAAAREGRSRLVTEIRNVLDLMRRGDGLRFEDVMMVDQSIFGIPSIHDRHRDMRLDVDNMTYEELLALEERIGDVCTGLSDETILSRLKQRKYICIKTEEPADAEPCCICREEYNDGEDLGTLDCGHDFHSDCIRQWLAQKNLCPICKTTGLTP